MHKRKIYLDTSVISHLTADDTPEKMRDTLKLWEEIKQDKWDVIVSRVALDEIDECQEPKKTTLLRLLGEIGYDTATETEETDALVDAYMKFGVLSRKSYDDCRHIAVATYYNCDIILSWNFKHFVNSELLPEFKQLINYWDTKRY